MTKRNVAIFLFDGVEVLDFAGPFEVFSVTSQLNNDELLNVYTVAEEARVITAVNGLKVVPDYDLTHCPRPEVLVIPGGDGSKQAMRQPAVLAWLREVIPTSEKTISICSGARLLAVLGFLDGLEATTHHEVLAQVQVLAPQAQVRGGVRFIDNGQLATAGGISAGIDLSLYVVAQLFGAETAVKTARYMEYDWRVRHNHTPFELSN